VKRTLKRDLKGLEIVKSERHANSFYFSRIGPTLVDSNKNPHHFGFICVNAILNITRVYSIDLQKIVAQIQIGP
jgi:hypothetical protein